MARENMSEVLKEVGALAVGALASKFFQNKVLSGMSFIPEKLKPAIPVVAGAFLIKTSKNGMLGDVGRGMIADGASSLASKVVPGLSGLTGDDMASIDADVSKILDNVLSGGDDEEMGDDGLHDDLSGDGDDGLHDDLGDDDDDGLHSDLSGDDEQELAEVEEYMEGDDDF